MAVKARSHRVKALKNLVADLVSLRVSHISCPRMHDLFIFFVSANSRASCSLWSLSRFISSSIFPTNAGPWPGTVRQKPSSSPTGTNHSPIAAHFSSNLSNCCTADAPLKKLRPTCFNSSHADITLKIAFILRSRSFGNSPIPDTSSISFLISLTICSALNGGLLSSTAVFIALQCPIMSGHDPLSFSTTSLKADSSLNISRSAITETGTSSDRSVSANCAIRCLPDA